MTGPLVTFAVFAYNQERFIEEAIRGALSQDYRPMEIIIADDASTDGTAAAIARALDGLADDRSVQVVRNPANRGLIGTINHVMTLAGGDILVLAAGDDVSLADRTTHTVRAFVEDSSVCSVHTNGMVIDEQGRELRVFFPSAPTPAQHTAEHAVRANLSVLGASHAWHRRIFEELGPLPERGAFEDHAIGFRSALLGTIAYVDRILIRYRQHGNNIFLGATFREDAVAEWYQWLFKFAQNEREMLLGRLEDLETAARRFPQRSTELAEWRKLTEATIEERTEWLRLLREPSRLERTRTIAARALRGMPPRRVVRWVLTFLFPRFYLRRIRRQAAIGATQSAP